MSQSKSPTGIIAARVFAALFTGMATGAALSKTYQIMWGFIALTAIWLLAEVWSTKP